MALHDLKAGRRKRRLLGDPRDSQGGRGWAVSLKQADRLREGQSPSRAQLLRPRAGWGGPHIPEHPPAWQC